jgi:hypothetical protein
VCVCAQNKLVCWWEHSKRIEHQRCQCGFTNWGSVSLFVGGTPLKGGSLSELPKRAFFNKILIRNRSSGGWFFLGGI